MTSVPAHRTKTVTAMTWNSMASNGVATLKWLRFPRITCPVMIAISPRLARVTTVPAHQPVRLPRVTSVSIQASESAYTTKDTANLKGLAQIAAPASTRSSASRPTPETTAITAMAAAKRTNGRCQVRH